MKTLDYMQYFNDLTPQEKIVKIKELRQKLFNLRIEGVEEDKLQTVRALIHWTAGNVFVPTKFPPTMEELKNYMYSITMTADTELELINQI